MADTSGGMTLEIEPFKIVTPVLPQELDASRELKALLFKSIGDDPFSMTIEEILDDIYARNSILFQWAGGKGVFLLTFGETPMWGKMTKVCWLTNLYSDGGESYIKHMNEIDDDILSICRKQGAKWLLGTVPSAALCRVYEKRTGAKTLHRVMREI